MMILLRRLTLLLIISLVLLYGVDLSACGANIEIIDHSTIPSSSTLFEYGIFYLLAFRLNDNEPIIYNMLHE